MAMFHVKQISSQKAMFHMKHKCYIRNVTVNMYRVFISVVDD